MINKVPFVDPKTHYQRIKREVDAAITSCLENGDLVDRQQLAAFEREFADFLGAKHVIGVNSGYHALHLSLEAAGIGAGDEVITVAHTFVATISAIVHCGATPVLVDVTNDFNMDVEAVERAITARTKAIMPVHLNGRVCNMEQLNNVAQKHKLTVIEDAAQAIGAKYNHQCAGTFGTAGCFSFYPFKMLGALGDAGAVATNDSEIALRIKRLRFNGEDRPTGEYHYHGYSVILDNVQAAVLSVKLKHLPAWIDHRRHIADIYRQELQDIDQTDLRLPHFSDTKNFDVYQNYVITTPHRDSLRTFLREHGIETLVSWPKPVWKHERLQLGSPDLPQTESICREVLSLPMNAEVSEEQARFVGQCVREFFDHQNK